MWCTQQINAGYCAVDRATMCSLHGSVQYISFKTSTSSRPPTCSYGSALCHVVKEAQPYRAAARVCYVTATLFTPQGLLLLREQTQSESRANCAHRGPSRSCRPLPPCPCHRHRRCPSRCPEISHPSFSSCCYLRQYLHDLLLLHKKSGRKECECSVSENSRQRLAMA